MDLSNSTPFIQRSDQKAAGINKYISVFSGRILSYAMQDLKQQIQRN